MLQRTETGIFEAKYSTIFFYHFRGTDRCTSVAQHQNTDSKTKMLNFLEKRLWEEKVDGMSKVVNIIQKNGF